MEEDSIWMRIKNVIAIVCLHFAGIFFIVFLTGSIIAFLMSELQYIGFNYNFYYLIIKWTNWLISSWSKLSWETLNYVKLKLLIGLLTPGLTSVLLYAIYFRKIIAWRLFVPKEKVYGDASWASPHDIKRANLRSKEGMMLGIDDDGYFVSEGFQHALLFAPTGSGKGVGFVIPNCLFWTHSAVVHDIKLENYEFTSGWRAKQGQEVYVWEPSNPDGVTHCYNPIDWVSKKPGQMVDDV